MGGDWTDFMSWPTKRVPMDGESVYIESFMHIQVDPNQTAKLKSLLVYGVLSF